MDKVISFVVVACFVALMASGLGSLTIIEKDWGTRRVSSYVYAEESLSRVIPDLESHMKSFEWRIAKEKRILLERLKSGGDRGLMTYVANNSYFVRPCDYMRSVRFASPDTGVRFLTAFWRYNLKGREYLRLCGAKSEDDFGYFGKDYLRW